MKENTHNPHIFPVFSMDKLTESLTSVSQGPHHNYRLGRRALFRVIRDCLCFCPFGNKRGGIFRNLRPNIFHEGILLNHLLNNLKDGHFIIKTFFKKFTTDLLRAHFDWGHFRNDALDLAPASSKSTPTTHPSPSVP